MQDPKDTLRQITPMYLPEKKSSTGAKSLVYLGLALVTSIFACILFGGDAAIPGAVAGCGVAFLVLEKTSG